MDYDELSYRELQKKCKEFGIQANGTKASIIERLINHDGGDDIGLDNSVITFCIRGMLSIYDTIKIDASQTIHDLKIEYGKKYRASPERIELFIIDSIDGTTLNLSDMTSDTDLLCDIFPNQHEVHLKSMIRLKGKSKSKSKSKT